MRAPLFLGEVRGAFLLVLLVGCAGTSAVSPVQISLSKVEEDPLPADPGQYKVPKGVDPTEWAQDLEAATCIDGKGNVAPNAGQPCPSQSGELLSEAKALKLAQYAIAYPELRRIFESDRRVWSAQRTLYEDEIKQDEAALEKERPDWWEQHKFEVGVIGGFILGSAATIGLYHVITGR